MGGAEAGPERRQTEGPERRLTQGLARVVVGADRIGFGLAVGLLGGGHALIEGVPGTAKTLTVRVISRLLGASYWSGSAGMIYGRDRLEVSVTRFMSDGTARRLFDGAAPKGRWVAAAVFRF